MNYFVCFEPLRSRAAGPAYYVLHPKKGINICVFLTYRPSKTGKESFPKKSCRVFKDLVVFDSQNKLETNSLIGVKGDCLYMLFSSFSKLF